MGRRVLVTRAVEGASALADALVAYGLEPVIVPAIEIAAPLSFAALDEALAQLQSYSWVLFTSASGVRAFAERRREKGTAPTLPQGLRIGVIGQATARAAQQAGLKVDLVPPIAVAESMAEALIPYAFQEGRPTRMLFLRAEEGREVLPEVLRAAGADVSVVAAYRNVVAAGSVRLLHSLFATDAPPMAAVTFTSASTVRNLLALCEAAAVRLPAEMLRISIGPVTSEALRAEKLAPHAEAPEATVVSLARCVWEVLKAQDEPAGKS